MRRTLAVVMVLILLMLGNNAAAVVHLPYSPEPASALWKLYDPELHYWYQQLTEAEKKAVLRAVRLHCARAGGSVGLLQRTSDAGEPRKNRLRAEDGLSGTVVYTAGHDDGFFALRADPGAG